jgi:HEPN domain-containing protein
MQNALSYLPQYKQDEIKKVVAIIKEVVQPEKIILFGSYATGSWVEDEYFENGIRYSYISDYDFLVVTKEKVEKEHVLNDQMVNRARNVTKIVVNAMIHEIDYVNEGLSFGQYFFADIVREGVVLYDTNTIQFVQAKELTSAEQKAVAQRYFDQWFKSADEFLGIAEYCKEKEQYNKAVFNLHQAAECFYNTILLVFTGYKPKTHSLEKLRQYAKPYSKELLEIFPENAPDAEYHLFDLLRRGYIDARYKQDYVITEEELNKLIEKVSRMKEVVERVCREKIKK